jgi:hypothetical protein
VVWAPPIVQPPPPELADVPPVPVVLVPLPAAPVALAPAAPVVLAPAAPVVLAPPAPPAPVSPVGGPVGGVAAGIAHAYLLVAPAGVHQALRTMQVAPSPQAVWRFAAEQVTLLVVNTVGQASHLYSVVAVLGGVVAEQETA